MRQLALVLGAVLVGGTACAAGLQVHHFGSTPIDGAQKTFVLLEDTEWETALRVALDERHFSLKKYASTDRVRENRITDSGSVTTERERTFNRAAARYGITLRQESKNLDWCPGTDHVKANFSLEVTDLRNDEVILLIRQGGWTGPCVLQGHGANVFESLVSILGDEWAKAHGASSSDSLR